MAKRAPASMTLSRSPPSSTVPAPTTASGTSDRIRAIAASAASLRRVTSSTGSPAETSVRASGTAASMSSMVSTGNTGACCRIVSTAAARSSGSHNVMPAPFFCRAQGGELRMLSLAEQCAGALFRRPGVAAHHAEQLATESDTVAVECKGRGRAGRQRSGVHFDAEHAFFGIDENRVPVQQTPDGAVAVCFRDHVNGCEHRAGGPRHASVREQGDALAAVLEDRQGGRELVQLGHAVGPGALAAYDGNEITV